MKKSIGIALACALFAGGALSVQAAAAAADPAKEAVVAKKPLNELFDQMAIVAYGQNKMFDNGRKSELEGSADIVQRDGRVLVPIRMMSSLATNAGPYAGMWEAVWQPQAPNDVLLKNSNLNKLVKLTVGSKTMLVNNVPQSIDTAPQMINGRIVLPLRDAAEALGKRIDWLDGLILIGDQSVDLQSPQTLAAKDKIKAELTDTRPRVEYGNAVYPITKYGSDVYYYKRQFKSNAETQLLYRKTDGQQETQVKLLGSPRLDSAKLIGGKLYYVAVVNGKTELDAFDFGGRTAKTISAIGDWKPEDGWVSDIRAVNGDMYLTLHSGDLTMGSEKLYKAGSGAAKSIASAKEFINYVQSGQYLYVTDFSPMFSSSGNGSRIDLKSGASAAFGVSGYTYGVNRTIDSQGLYYGMNDSLYLHDGFLYTLGYKESDESDASAVYRIDAAKGTQTKLTPPASDFWLANDRIYYLDSATGYLRTVQLDGGGGKTLSARKASNVQFANGGIYYTVGTNASNVLTQGDLYRYDLAKGSESKLSERAVRSFYVGADSVYYVSDGYELGLYKIDAAGRNVRLVHDSIDTASWSADGMTYTKVYEPGIFSVR